MNPPWSQTDLMVLSNLCRLLAAVTLAFAAVGIVLLTALTFAEWRAAVRESRARRRRHPPGSAAALATRLGCRSQVAAATKHQLATATHDPQPAVSIVR